MDIWWLQARAAAALERRRRRPELRTPNAQRVLNRRWHRLINKTRR